MGEVAGDLDGEQVLEHAQYLLVSRDRARDTVQTPAAIGVVERRDEDQAIAEHFGGFALAIERQTIALEDEIREGVGGGTEAGVGTERVVCHHTEAAAVRARPIASPGSARLEEDLVSSFDGEFGV